MIYDDVELGSSKNYEMWIPQQSVNADQVSLKVVDTKGIVYYEIDWSKFHENPR